MPSSCSNEDVKDIFKIMTGHENVTVDARKCQVKEASKYNAVDIIFA
jgi:hypothetical protein